MLRSSVVLSLSIAALLLPACSREKSAQTMKKGPVPVTVAAAVQKAVPIQEHAIGNVEAYSTIAIKSQISGELLKAHFREGQEVSKGELLFTIDPRSFELLLKQAEANLARDTAQFETARQEAKRYEDLVSKGYVSQSQFDQMSANAFALKAIVDLDRAAVENARLQLSYCFIHAPITGRTGSLMVNQGNLIKANDTQLVVLNQLEPIYVSFSVPEKQLPDIKKYQSAGTIKIEAQISKDALNPEKGTLSFIDNAIDNSTGSIKLKGIFNNKTKKLWPGQFVNVVMTLAMQPDAIVVPLQAVQTGQTGQYIFVVKEDNTVESRPITVAMNMNQEAVIAKGLKSGEKVVTDGQLRLVPGTTVEIKTPAEEPKSKNTK